MVLIPLAVAVLAGGGLAAWLGRRSPRAAARAGAGAALAGSALLALAAVRGLGAVAPEGLAWAGPAGDFVLTIEVEEHAFFRRDGEDLHCTIDVGMIEAAMGGHVEAKTPDGPVTIEVPAGTQNGQRFRLRKRGVPHPGGGGRGDLWVEVRVRIPAATDDRARALLRELAGVLPRS